MNQPLRIGILTTDSRHWFREFDSEIPNLGTAIQALLEGLDGIPSVEVHVISATPSPLRSPEKLAPNIWFHHLQVAKWGWGKTLFLGVVIQIRKLVQELNLDIVHGQGTERDCAVSAVHSGRPNVITIHGNMAELNRLGDTFKHARLYGMIASHLESHALGRTSGVLCNSLYTESLVKPRARHTWLVPNAIRAIFFSEPKPLEQHRNVPMLLNVGHLGPRKRQLEVLRMAGELHRAGKEFHLSFVGSVPEHDEYSATFAAELSVAEQVGYASHLGVLKGQNLVDCMDQAQGFVHFPTEEAFGLVVAESMARGLTFFGAGLGGIKDIAAGVPDAHLYETLDELETGLATWLDAGAARSPQAAEIMKQRYHPEVIACRHLEIYHEVIGH